MAEKPLTDFVDSALRAGASRAETERVLLEAGWARDQVSDALRHFADVDFAVPVPRPRAQTSASDAFLYLVMFGMLYISAFNFGSLLFQFINLAFPDPLALSNRFADETIRWSTSALLIAFPVFLFVACRIERGIARDPTRRSSGVRKWLTYLTLFLAACIIVGDLITLLYGLLSGELTLRVILKALTVGLISGAIFGYYLWSMRMDDAVLAQ